MTPFSKAVLDASDAAGVKRVLAVLIQASKDAPTAGAPADAAAAAVAAAAAQPAGHPPAGGGSSGMDGTMLVARIDELGADARRPVTPRPPPPDHIPTMASHVNGVLPAPCRLPRAFLVCYGSMCFHNDIGSYGAYCLIWCAYCLAGKRL
jgi:hypothetical protein